MLEHSSKVLFCESGKNLVTECLFLETHLECLTEICFSMQRNWAILLCCGYKKSIPQSSIKASSRQSTIFDLHVDKYVIFLDFFCSLTLIMAQAGNFLVRSENIDDTVWSEIVNAIRRDADYLFKIIGKAYAILSDPTMVGFLSYSGCFCSC